MRILIFNIYLLIINKIKIMNSKRYCNYNNTSMMGKKIKLL